MIGDMRYSRFACFATFSSYLPAGAHRSAEFDYIQYAALCRFRECARFQYHAVVKPIAL